MMESSNSLIGAANIISKTANNVQAEIANQLGESHPSENRPLLDKDESQNISRPMIDSVSNDVTRENKTSHEVEENNEAPVITEAVPVSVQPNSAVALSDKLADSDSNEESNEARWWGCDEMYCNCNCGERSCVCGKTSDGYRCVLL